MSWASDDPRHHGLGRSHARRRGRKAFVQGAEAAGHLLWIPAPVLFELWEGIERSDKSDDERVMVRDILSDYTILAFDARHAIRSGIISGRAVRRGRMIDPLDAQIAGCALEERLPVVTRNVKHFARVPDLEVVSY